MVINYPDFKNKRTNWLGKNVKVAPSKDIQSSVSTPLPSSILEFPNRSHQRNSQNSSLSAINGDNLPKNITDELRQKILNNPKLAHLYVIRAQRECRNNPSSEATRLCKEYEKLYEESKILHSKKIKQHNHKKLPIPDDQLTY